MLSIDEAIAHTGKVEECLEEPKAIREMDLSIPQHFTKKQSDWIKAYCIQRNKEFYNKALDDFAEKLLSQQIVDKSVVRRVKEQLKAGDNNGT